MKWNGIVEKMKNGNGMGWEKWVIQTYGKKTILNPTVSRKKKIEITTLKEYKFEFFYSDYYLNGPILQFQSSIN